MKPGSAYGVQEATAIVGLENRNGWNKPPIAMATGLAFWVCGNQENGLFLFFLPPYCSEMNPIETQWHQLKSHEIAGQMFDNEYDLAMAVIDGMKARSEAGQYTLERFIFNCT